MRERQEISLYRPVRTARLERNTLWKRPDVSAVAAVYGANAAGKSTLTAAIHFLVSAVEESYRSWDPGGGVPRMPFLLDSESEALPTEFEIEFAVEDGTEYQYGFSVDHEKVLSEYLHAYKTKRKTVLFERSGPDWRFGPSFKGPAQQIRAITRANSLFLSAAAAADLQSTKEVHEWLTEHLFVYSASAYDAEHALVASIVDDDPVFRQKILSFLSRADLGVSNIGVVREEMTREEREALTRTLSGVEGATPARIEEFLKSREVKLSLEHQGTNGAVPLPIGWESEGTLALISFASVAIRALDRGNVCVIDEIDTSLHPSLVAELVSIFANPLINTRQAQLIFTTHDVSLLNARPDGRSALDRDQIWVVEKSKNGASTLVAVSEYRTPRIEENLERSYLTGRFGGLPSLNIATDILKSWPGIGGE